MPGKLQWLAVCYCCAGVCWRQCMLWLHYHPHLPVRPDWHDGVLQRQAAGCQAATPASTRRTCQTGHSTAQVCNTWFAFTQPPGHATGKWLLEMCLLSCTCHETSALLVDWCVLACCADTTTGRCTRLLLCYHSTPRMRSVQPLLIVDVQRQPGLIVL